MIIITSSIFKGRESEELSGSLRRLSALGRCITDDTELTGGSFVSVATLLLYILCVY